MCITILLTQIADNKCTSILLSKNRIIVSYAAAELLMLLFSLFSWTKECYNKDYLCRPQQLS